MTYKIFDSANFMDDQEIREILEDAGAEITEKNIELEREFMNRANAEDFWDNVKAVEEEGYAVIADLGLWYGRRKAWAVTQTLHDALWKCAEYMDDLKVEETARGKLLVTGYHHDGTNHYEVYRLKKYSENEPVKSNLRNVHLRKLLGWV